MACPRPPGIDGGAMPMDLDMVAAGAEPFANPPCCGICCIGWLIRGAICCIWLICWDGAPICWGPPMPPIGAIC